MHGAYVRVIERWQANSFDVFVFPERPREGALSTHIHRHVEGETWRTEEVGEPDPFTGLPRPSFSVPATVMEQLLAQAKKLVPSLDRDDAVTDARATRDRLLALVEGVVSVKAAS